METKVYDQNGKELGSVTLNENVFGVEVNTGLIHRALMLQLSNARAAIAHTKTRGERQGSTRKIYKQKGTGRARMGSNRSPIRRKGWVAFGPRSNRNFELQMNRKERQKALFCMLSSKVASNGLVVVRNFELSEIKTKNMLAVVKALPLGKNALIALASKNENIEKSAANLANIKTLPVSYLNMADLLKYETLVLPEDALAQVNALA